jgi:tetratricopeptide (TPR) repeat protein
MLRATIFAIGVCVLPGANAAERPLSPDSYYFEARRARALFERNQYEQALPLIQRLTGYYEDDSSAWIAAAISANETGRLEQALDAARRAVQIGAASERYNWFEIAKLYAKLGQPDHALESLERALETRYTPRTRIRDEPAFRALYANDRFRRIAALLPEQPFSRDEGWRYDLALLAGEARRLHASPRREAFSDEFAKATAELNDRIPGLADGQIRVGMQQLLTLLRDGHTGIDIDHRAQRLPLRLYFFPEGVFIIDASDQHKGLIGSRVTRIGSRSIDQLVADLPAYIPRDNRVGIDWRGPHTLVHMDFLQALGAVQRTNAASVEVENAKGTKRIVGLVSVPAADAEWRSLYTSRQTLAETPLHLQRAATPYWTRRLSPQTLYFQFNGVWETREQSIKDFALALHRDLDDGMTRNLIVDVRHNPGGNLGLYPPLLQAISAFRIGDTRHEIYCITGRNTFSAAQAFIGDLERLVNPVFVGEPSSSSPNFVGESTGWIELPYSGTRVMISERHHQHAALPDDARTWIAPHLPVELTASDYFSNRDPVMDAVLRVIESR